MTKKRRRIIFIGGPLIVALAIMIALKLEVDRVEASALLLAQTGQAAIKMLDDYRAGINQFVSSKDASKILDCYANNYLSDREGQWTEKLESDRDGVRVYEWKVENPQSLHRTEVADSVARYLQPIVSMEESKFKLDAVEQTSSAESAVVRGVLWLRGQRKAPNGAADEAFESHALVRLWIGVSGGLWKVTKQELIHGETVTGDRRGFTDITKSAGIDFVSHHNPMWSLPEWKPTKYEMIRFGPGGVSAVDYDNDGWYDIFFADGLGPRLYRNNHDGTFTDVTAKSGLPTELFGVDVGIFADFDNDGYKDLFLGCSTSRNRLFKNNGNGTFTDITDKAGDLGGYFSVVAAAADYDNDGKLDLYVGRYLDPRKNNPTTLFYTRNGEGNHLLHNDGNLHFTEVTAKAGVRDGGLALGVAWGDYDNDGYQDLYISNDFGRNTLFHNNGNGTFNDVSKETGTLDFGYGMSATFGDINNDGRLDLYVSNVHSGQRWYGQAATLYQYLLTSTREGTMSQDFSTYKEIYQLVGADFRGYGDKMVRGNTLLINDGKGKFVDVTEASRTNPFGWFWSSTMFDFDNDGRQDIYAVDGWISGKKKDDL